MTTIPTFNCWFTCPQPNLSANLRLFCFPGAGGGSSHFRTWSANLPLTVEVWSVEFPGRGTQMQSTLFTRLEPLVCALAKAFLPYLGKPFAFFGHSMGGLISFELARLLRKNYRISPLHLFVSGRRAPQLPSTTPPLHLLPEPEFIEQLRRFNGTPKAVLENAELMQLFLPILRADFAVLENYVYAPEPCLDFPISAFGGWLDQEVKLEDLEAWQEQTNASFRLQMFPGDHFFIHSARSLLLQSVAQQLLLF